MKLPLPARGALAWAMLLGAIAPALFAESTPGPHSGLERAPKPIHQESPEYPYSMSQAGLIGEVNVQFDVDKSGNVINPFVLESNNPWFERPAIDAILKWKFEPGLAHGQPVNVRVHQVVSFQMDREEGENLWRARKAKDHEKLPPELRWDEGPIPVGSTYPVYPAEALRAGRRGHAVVRFVVDRQGGVGGSKVIEASAPEFGNAALAAMDVWRFKPATRQGQPCSALFEMEYHFKPAGDSTVPVSRGMQNVIAELERKEPRLAGLGELDARPKPLSRRPPTYPTALGSAGTEGEAVIEFYIDKNGDAELPRVVSATAPEFGFAAAQAISTWRFEPPRKNGKPVIVHAQITVPFKIHPSSPGGDSSR